MPGQCHHLSPVGTARKEKATQNWAPGQKVEPQAWGWPVRDLALLRDLLSKTQQGLSWSVKRPWPVRPHLQVKLIGPMKVLRRGRLRSPQSSIPRSLTEDPLLVLSNTGR